MSGDAPMGHSIALYGIPNCDQVKKARVWLDSNGIAFTFHDFKKGGISRAMIESWLADLSWEQLVNKKGTTWRQLSDQRKAAIIDAESATVLMLEAPSVVKRPVLVLTPGRIATGGGATAATHAGFSEALYGQLFA